MKTRRQRGNARLYLLAVVLALVAAFAWLWFREPGSLPPWLRPERAEPVPGAGAGPASTAQPASNRPVYRWRDDAGVLQVTDTPPRGRPYDTVRIDPDTNVVPSTLPQGYEHYGQPGEEDAESGD